MIRMSVGLMVFALGTAAGEVSAGRPKQVQGLPPCPVIKGARAMEQDGHAGLEIRVKMDVDVDGAPNAYGPRGSKTLDVLAHSQAPRSAPHPGEVVGYMTEYDGGPPTVQRKGDPYPGLYVSQTDFADLANKRMEDPRRYVDATKINYVVQGVAARKGGVVMGDYAVVYSCRTGKAEYAIVADSGNPTGAEGSLALVRALGYKITDGVEDSVDEKEIIVRYYPKSNPAHFFPKTQGELDEAAKKLGLKFDGVTPPQSMKPD